ncbi:STM4015 family protein [Nocardiopsis aegyptia]|uniref:STM4015 family protein n=1 Tax=Nocardiopsis aegyptia TaxID=220378 RepID=UPI00367050CD
MDNLTEFAGLPVVDFPLEETAEEWRGRLRRVLGAEGDPAAVPSAASAAWRLRISGRTEMNGTEQDEAFARFLAEVGDQVTALTLGTWVDGSLHEPVALLVEHADALPNLRSVFVGDIHSHECELSWIAQPDLAPLVAAFPRLEELAVRGASSALGGELSLQVPSHEALRRLTIQSGGLPGSVAREVASSGLPALEHLELWLGVEDYGGSTWPQDLAPVLAGEAFPELRYLGVRNAESVDGWIPALAEAPVVKRVEVLDLSLGCLTDRGGRELVDRAGAFAGLRWLDLHHHYLSEEMEERVRAAFAGTGVEVDLAERLEPDTEMDDEDPMYYTAASE